MFLFTALSSSIGRKLLVFALRQVDILDKDPGDFVSVDVGKRTTLEVRDVGLHIKKLIALLHLDIPPEICLSKARASLLRVTFILEFGVPHILIEVDGIQVHAQLAQVPLPASKRTSPVVKSRGKRHHDFRVESAEPPPSSPTVDDGSVILDDSIGRLPTAEDLAKSFIREEPEQEIRELEEAISNEPVSLHESVESSSDGDDENVAGMGAPLGLPGYLKNLINAALDRVQIFARSIDIQVDDQLPGETSSSSSEATEASVSLNFHIDSVTVDSVTAQDPSVNISGSAISEDILSRIGKRRMHVVNVCGKILSDVDSSASASRSSVPSSPIMAFSQAEASTYEGHRSATSIRGSNVHEATPVVSHLDSSIASEPPSTVEDASAHSIEDDLTSGSPEMHQSIERESSMKMPPDEDRFADADQDAESISGSQNFESQEDHGGYGFSGIFGGSQNLSASSVLYDDGLLEYALEHDLVNSTTSTSPGPGPLGSLTGLIEDGSFHSQQSEDHTVSDETGHIDIGLSSKSNPSHPNPRQEVSSILRDAAIPDAAPKGLSVSEHETTISASPVASDHSTPTEEGDLSQSKLFEHEEAESMYMSAMSGSLALPSQHHVVPGAWESSTSSSHDTSSDDGTSIASDMVAGSILQPVEGAEDGCETPRPGSSQSQRTSEYHTSGACDDQELRQGRVFLTVDYITLWFPLGFGGTETQVEARAEDASAAAEGLDFSFTASHMGQSSMFQEMPGSFSNYAHATTTRRKPSVDIRAPVDHRLDPTTPPSKDRKPAPLGTPSTVSLKIGSMVTHIDFPSGRIMFQMFERLAKVASSGKETDEKPTPILTTTSTNAQTSFDLSIQTLTLAWVERLVSESTTASVNTCMGLDPMPLHAILWVNFSMIRLGSQGKTGGTRSILTIGKFRLGSLDQSIVSFLGTDHQARRFAKLPAQQANDDIEIVMESTEQSRVTIVTRPLKILFDIQKLDEALGSLGGFSGVLELGSSISSGNSSPRLSSTTAKPREVHFGEAPKEEVPAAPSSMPKIDIKLGEVSLELKARCCSVRLETSTIRAAIRESNVRLKVAEVRATGPITAANQKSTPLVAEIKGTTLSFLYSPEEVDLARLISMITPSKDPYESNEDILIDTLLRQRRKGSVLRLEVTSIGIRISDTEQLSVLELLGAEFATLSKVTKYLPDDDRPGLLTLASCQELDALVAVNEQLGDFSIALRDTSVAHVGVPSLFAVEVGAANLHRNEEELMHGLVRLRPQDQLPMIMARIIGDEMDPVVKVKLFNVCFEYQVSTVMAALGIGEDGTTNDIAVGLASSVATITGGSSPRTVSTTTSQAKGSSDTRKPLHIDVLFRTCALGLNPRNLNSRGLFVLSDARTVGKQVSKDYVVDVNIRKASIHIIDDVDRISDRAMPAAAAITTSLAQRQLHELADQGFVSLGSLSAATISITIESGNDDADQIVNVEVKNELFVLESCADSTQTLLVLLTGLQPPSPPSTAQKYRTVVPLQEMMESVTGDSFSVSDAEAAEENFMDTADLVMDEVPASLEFVGSFYNPESLPTDEELGDSLLDQEDLGAVAPSPVTRKRGEPTLLESFQEQYEVADNEKEFDFDENYFRDSPSEYRGQARKWDSRKNQYQLSNEFKVPNAPLKVRLRDTNLVWNLYDGFDWPRTRDIFSKAVDDVEARAEARRQRARDEDEDDDDFVEQDFLFNSVWIGVPVKDEKGALRKQINHDIDDLVSETGSYATSTATRSTGATVRPRSSTKSGGRKLKLKRSKNKKLAIQLSGVAVDLVVYPTNTGETQSSLNLRVHDFEIFDHVPSSTWNKFVTSLIDPKDRELSRPMINLEVLTVRPVTDLAASELVLRVKVLPLRLHVDQDAVDFMLRFFMFKDDSQPQNSTPADGPFIQRLEVQSVTLKMDYKPKRVDYRGLRYGHTTELMNFLILDEADIVLRHVIVYGITSFDKLHKTLNDVWMPDITRNQLPGVLGGLAAVRPLVNVGSGVRDLVTIPIREYRKDGRIVRSLQKGVSAFAKNTTSGVARLGARLAVGTQNLLEGAETFLNPEASASQPSSAQDYGEFETIDSGDEEPRAVSNYANQPLGVKVGMRNAARYLERDLLLARDAVVAIPTEIMEQGTGIGAAKVIARRAPTIILKPALGATKAVSNALLGVGNALDKDSKRKVDNKYKSY